MTPLSITIAYFPFLNPCPSILGHTVPAYSVSAAITGAHKREKPSPITYLLTYCVLQWVIKDGHTFYDTPHIFPQSAVLIFV